MVAGVELHVPDFGSVKSFYGELGFHVVWEHPPDPDRGYLVMQREDNVLRFWPGTDWVKRQPYFSQFSAGTKRGFGVEIVLCTTDLDAIHAAARQLGAVVEAMKSRPWGLRDFRVEDPFGYYLRFTEPHDVRDATYAGRPG